MITPLQASNFLFTKEDSCKITLTISKVIIIMDKKRLLFNQVLGVLMDAFHIVDRPFGKGMLRS